MYDWIQSGCENDEYYCLEKNASFIGSYMPDTMPDLSQHSSFFADAMNMDLYAKLKDRTTSQPTECIKKVRSLTNDH